MTTEHQDILTIVAKNPGITSAEIAEKMDALGYYRTIDKPSNWVSKQMAYLKKVAKVSSTVAHGKSGTINRWTLAPEYNPEPAAVIEPKLDTEPTAYYPPAALAELVESADEDDEMASDVQESIGLAIKTPWDNFMTTQPKVMDAVMTPDYTAHDVREALKEPFCQFIEPDTAGLWADCINAVAYAPGLQPAISHALLDCADWLEGLTG